VGSVLVAQLHKDTKYILGISLLPVLVVFQTFLRFPLPSTLATPIIKLAQPFLRKSQPLMYAKHQHRGVGARCGINTSRFCSSFSTRSTAQPACQRISNARGRCDKCRVPPRRLHRRQEPNSTPVVARRRFFHLSMQKLCTNGLALQRYASSRQQSGAHAASVGSAWPMGTSQTV
jgi:hypothetical protein